MMKLGLLFRKTEKEKVSGPDMGPNQNLFMVKISIYN